MPLIKPKSPHAFGPKGPHLALLTEEDAGALPLPPGAVFIIIETADGSHDPNHMFPVALTKVTRKRLDFICPCGQKNCTRRVVFHATWSGLHPKGTPEISVAPPLPVK